MRYSKGCGWRTMNSEGGLQTRCHLSKLIDTLRVGVPASCFLPCYSTIRIPFFSRCDM